MAEKVVIPTAGLTAALTEREGYDAFLKLFVTNVTPTAATTAGDLTEAVGGGYAHKWVKGKTTPAAAQIEGLSQAAACVVTWTGHGMTTGDKVTFAAIEQAGWVALIAEHVITFIGADSFSIPVNSSGYAAPYDAGTDPGTVVETTPCAWTEEFANTPPDIIMAEQTFTFNGELTTNKTIYGWYLVKQSDGAIIASKKLDSTYEPASGGGTLKFTPRIQAGNGTPA